MFTDKSEVRSFLLAGKKEPWKELHISRASYYRKVGELVALIWRVEECDRAQRNTGCERETSELRDALVRLVVEHPGWGRRRLATALQTTCSNIGEVLHALNLVTPRERIEFLAEKVLEGKISQLSQEQRTAIVKVNPFVNDAPLLGNGEELAVRETLVPITQVLGKGHYVRLVVELNSHFAYGRIIRKTRDGLANLEMDNDSTSDLRCLDKLSNGRRCFGRREEKGGTGLNLPRQLPAAGRQGTATGISALPAGVQVMKGRLEREWLKGEVRRGSLQLEDIRASLLRWLIKHNCSRTKDGFPTDGKAPATILGLERKEVESFLKGAVSNERREQRRFPRPAKAT